VPLEPSGASVGLDIRVVGNDSGEKVRPAGGLPAGRPPLVRARCAGGTADGRRVPGRVVGWMHPVVSEGLQN